MAAHAQQIGYATKLVNLRAGPARDCPVVFVARTGAEMLVQGCINDYA